MEEELYRRTSGGGQGVVEFVQGRVPSQPIEHSGRCKECQPTFASRGKWADGGGHRIGGTSCLGLSRQQEAAPTATMQSVTTTSVSRPRTSTTFLSATRQVIVAALAHAPSLPRPLPPPPGSVSLLPIWYQAGGTCGAA